MLLRIISLCVVMLAGQKIPGRDAILSMNQQDLTGHSISGKSAQPIRRAREVGMFFAEAEAQRVLPLPEPEGCGAGDGCDAGYLE
jgi:hypothetical protein